MDNFKKHIPHGKLGEIDFQGRRYFVQGFTQHTWPEERQIMDLEDAATGETFEMEYRRTPKKEEDE